MVTFLIAKEDLSAHAEMLQLYDSKTLFATLTVCDEDQRSVLAKLLNTDMLVVLPDDVRRWNLALHKVRRALMAVDAKTTTVSKYLTALSETNPPAGRAASPASHVPAGGNLQHA